MRLKKSSGKVLDLSMEEGSGNTAYDSSRYGNDGAVNGGVEWTEHGMRFDGSTGYLDCGNDESLDITDAITLSAWINPITYGENNGGRVIEKRDPADSTPAFILNMKGSTNAITIYIAGNSYSASNNSITLGKWQHVVMSYDKQNVKIFVDTVEKLSAPETDVMYVSSGNLVVGSDISTIRAFDGIIADVRIHNRALTPLEIKHDYDATKYKYL